MSSNVRIELIYRDVINVLLNLTTKEDKVTKGQIHEIDNKVL